MGGVRRPTGTVTFLFTDIEASTRLWDAVPDMMAGALEEHDAIVNRTITAAGGIVFATGGDGFCVAFGAAAAAVAAAVEAQRQLSSYSWPADCVLRVRMGIHTGEAVERAGDYFGPAVNTAARVMSAAHGGQILCTDIVSELLAGTVSTAPLGEHELRGVATAVHIHQVTGEGLQADFGPLRTLESVRTNLPHEITAPVGRDDLVADVVELATSGRLVTLTGVGGVGKTTVALAAGRRLLDGAKQGVWLVELAAVTQPDQILDAVAAALRVSPSGGVSLRDSLAAYLDRRDLVLVLDNCEQIVDGVAEVAGWLLSTCRSVRLVATSREALRAGGEQVVAVAPLEVPTLDSAVGVRAAPAGELFLARAAQAGAAWRLDETNAAAVAQLCRSLDGVPLALELAAARTAQLSVEAIASLLGARLDVLSRGRRSGEARHRSLVAALEWSYELLEPHEQKLLRQLAVFVDGFDVDGVVAVAVAARVEEWDTLEALSSLVAKSLVEHYPLSTGRYRMLETVRAFSAALGQHDASTAQAHAEHYLTLLSDALRRLDTTDGVQATEILVADAANVEAALGWCAANGRGEDAFAPFMATLVFGLTTMPLTVTDALLRPLERLVLEPGAERMPGFSAACAVAAMLVLEAPERERLPRIVEASRRAVSDAHTAFCEATGRATTGDMAGGVQVLRAGLESAADPLLRASLLGFLAVFEAASESPDALSHAEEALALAREHGGTLTQQMPLAALAISCRDDLPRSVAAANEARRLDRSFRRTGSSMAILFAAQATAAVGDVSSAVLLLRSSIAQMARAGNRAMLAITIGGAADGIARSAPEAALQLAGLAESGAITSGVAIFDNVGYRELRRVAADKDPAELEAMRTEFAEMGYEEAIQFVLNTLDDVAERLSMAAKPAKT